MNDVVERVIRLSIARLKFCLDQNHCQVSLLNQFLYRFGKTMKWRCRLWTWEEKMLGECMSLFHDILSQHNFADHWQWKPDPSGGYSIRGVYQLLTSQEVHNNDVTTHLTWHKQTPLKVSIFSWRLLRNRLPSKDNLVARAIIPLETQHCVIGCGDTETAQHLIISCPRFGSLRGLVRAWLGTPAADPFHL